MNGFEHLVHTARREEGELSVERIGELWAESQSEMLGDSVEITEGYRTWWSYIPTSSAAPATCMHMPTPAAGAVGVSALRADGPELVPRYLEMLAAGGSRSPQELGEIVGVDLSDRVLGCGLDLVERQLTDAEAAAEASGRL